MNKQKEKHGASPNPGKQEKNERPWGYYIVLADEPDHKVKRIVIAPGKRISLQLHEKRSEHWHIVSGKAIVHRHDEIISLEPGDSIDIPQACKHRIQNPGPETLAFIEIQRGEYFGEDDIIRIQDDFGRD